MRILLLSPFHGGSHEAWATGLMGHSAHDFHTLTLPASNWHWRMQGGAVELADAALALPRDCAPDMILATSMLDLTTFSALTRRRFAGVPLVLYMHENQLTYPITSKGSRSHAAVTTQWKAMLCADHILFNSQYHHDSLFEALPAHLRSAPDFDPLRFVDAVRGKSSVLHVGVDIPAPMLAPEGERRGSPLILWNQRWSHDKNPEAVLHSLLELHTLGFDFRVALCGDHGNKRIPLFEETRARLGDKLVHFGWAERDEYLDLVQHADIVLSAAHHEFFGIAVIEALRCGAMGVLPNRLSYPGLIEPASAPRQLYDNAGQRMRLLSAAVRSGGFSADERRAIAPYYARYDWSSLAPEYDTRFGEFASG